MSNPEKTIVNELNQDDWDRFKEQRRFETYRQKGHFYFDKIWREAKIMSRIEAYKWLANILGVTEPEAHFTYLNDSKCREVIYFCQQLLNDNRRLDLDFGADPITPFYILN